MTLGSGSWKRRQRSASEEVWSGSRTTRATRRPLALRAADADREIIHRVLGDAFADGRLDREEYDERSASVLARPDPR